MFLNTGYNYSNQTANPDDYYYYQYLNGKETENKTNKGKGKQAIHEGKSIAKGL